MMRPWLAPLTLSAAALLLAGCQSIGNNPQLDLKSATPAAATYPYTTQQKMQTAHHWELLASDMATRLVDALPDKSLSLYVSAPGQTTFNQAFQRLLTEQLLRQGALVALEPAAGVAEVKYDVLLIKHQGIDRPRPAPGNLTALGAGLVVARNAIKNGWTHGYAALPLAGLAADWAVGRSTSAEDREVLITTSMNYGNRLLMSDSNLYYINAGGEDHYTAQALNPGKLIQVVDK
ncbi:hypothetical protein [Balneatrix alpica]|uniref:Uncharacterized protein n=1 Tax=Balneatrix alpica TaxID=75684 RepID=A0ABV5ZFK5_9GAMM|nr:hypothetical protein [Balneatrix alpica]